MNAARQAIWLCITLAVLAGFGYYYASKPPLPKLDAKTLSQTPDAIVTGLSVRQYDEKGQLSNALSTPELQHIPENDTHLLKMPHIIVAQPDQPHWEITSEHAKAVQGGQEITFINKVQIHQNASEKEPYSTLRTESLTYYPAKQLATTAMNVIFERPGTVVKSKGLRANLAEKHIQLLNKAQAVFEPNHG